MENRTGCGKFAVTVTGENLPAGKENDRVAPQADRRRIEPWIWSLTSWLMLAGKGSEAWRHTVLLVGI